jgi:nicotinamidase-related amidase
MISPCIFIDVDTQNDFFDPKGAMPIKGAVEIRANLKALTRHALKQKIKIVAGTEIYDPKKPNKGQKFCLAGTKGQKKITETLVKNPCTIPAAKKKINYAAVFKKNKQIIIEKSNFKLFGNSHVWPLLKASRIKNFVVYGIAVDYGIEQVILKLLEKGCKVWIPVDAVKPINEENREPVMKELRSKGAEMWNTDFIIKNT